MRAKDCQCEGLVSFALTTEERWQLKREAHAALVTKNSSLLKVDCTELVNSARAILQNARSQHVGALILALLLQKALLRRRHHSNCGGLLLWRRLLWGCCACILPLASAAHGRSEPRSGQTKASVPDTRHARGARESSSLLYTSDAADE